jgi:hypothetical protein
MAETVELSPYLRNFSDQEFIVPYDALLPIRASGG